MASDIWLRTILIVRKETRCRLIGYSYRLTAKVLLHTPSNRQDITHTTAFVTPVVDHWLEREIAQWVHPMNDRSDDPPHHERTLYLWATSRSPAPGCEPNIYLANTPPRLIYIYFCFSLSRSVPLFSNCTNQYGAVPTLSNRTLKSEITRLRRRYYIPAATSVGRRKRERNFKNGIPFRYSISGSLSQSLA